jgi:pyridoxal phosphate enzyme (YggS family)
MNESSAGYATSVDALANRLDEVRTRIASAALRCGRKPESVALVAIAKGQPAQAVRALAHAGQKDFGENYLQEALPKLAELADVAHLGLTWHFTGQLQGNKTRSVAEHFHWVHTVDRERIAIRLSEQRPAGAPPLNVCIQVRLADEAGKGGVEPAKAGELARQIASLPRLCLRGLMCIPPHSESHQEQLAWFKKLAACRDDLNTQGLRLDTLSMGMSADLDAAIEAGATLVRVGTALFGERAKHANQLRPT